MADDRIMDIVYSLMEYEIQYDEWYGYMTADRSASISLLHHETRKIAELFAPGNNRSNHFTSLTHCGGKQLVRALFMWSMHTG